MKCLVLTLVNAPKLNPLFDKLPKQLKEMNSKTILDWLVDDIDSSGLVDQYFVISMLDAIFFVRISRHGLCPLFSSARKVTRPPAVAGA